MVPSSRPQTSVSNREREDPSTRNGMPPPSRSSTSTSTSTSASASEIYKRNPQYNHSTQSLPAQHCQADSRASLDLLLCGELAAMCLEDTGLVSETSQATSSTAISSRASSPSPTPMQRKPQRTSGFRRPPVKAPSGQVKHRGVPCTQPCITPDDAQTPWAKSAPSEGDRQLESLHKNTKATVYSIATPSPTKGFFLTKDSNTTGFVVTDIDEKIGKLDSDFARMKEFMDSSAVDKDRLVEELDLAKRRGKSPRNLRVVGDSN